MSKKLINSLILIVTYRCNFKCSYCYVEKGEKDIPLETAKKAIDLFFGHLKGASGPKYIKLFGGEPLLCLDLVKKIVDYAAGKNILGLKILLTTNGSKLNKEILEWIKRRPIELSISLDGDYAAQRKNRKTCTETFSDLIGLIGQYPADTIINMVIAPNQVERLTDNFEYLFGKGFRRFNLLPAAYQFWPQAKIGALNSNLKRLLFFARKNLKENIYFKNTDINNETFFFNSGFVVDYDGSIFLNNLVLFKNFRHLKDRLCLGNVEKIRSFGQVMGKNDTDFNELLKKETDSKTHISNVKVDGAINMFVKGLRDCGSSPAKKLDIKISYRCNNRCKFCAQGHKREKLSDRSTEELKKDITLASRDYRSIVFTGGEPTIRPDLLELVRHARSQGYKEIQIQTNGRMFAYKEFCKKAIDAGANNFCLALHGHNPKVHDFLTGSQGSFRETISGISNLAGLGQIVTTQTVITSHNYKYLPRIASLLLALDAKSIQFAFMHIIGSCVENKTWIVPRKSEIAPYVKKAIDLCRAKDRRVTTEAIPYCFMRGYEECVVESTIPDAMVIETRFTIKDYTSYRKNRGKVKGLHCKRCSYFDVCEGPWKEYPEMFGWDEFVPVKQDKLWDEYYKRHPRDAAWGAKEADGHVVDFVEHYKFAKNARILDSGCGHGKNSSYLIKKGCEVFGIDISRLAIKYSKDRNPSGSFSLQDAVRLKFRNNFFDAVIDAGCFHVNPSLKRGAIIENYHRVLKPGGKLFIRIFNNADARNKARPFFYEEDLPVWGMGKAQALGLFRKKFRVKRTLFQEDYGAEGVHYLYLEKI